MSISKALLFLFLVCSLSSCKSKNETELVSNPTLKFPKPIAYVSDFEQVFTSEEHEALEKLIVVNELKTTNEIAIITISSIEPYNTITDYATDLGNEWGIGKADEDNGLLIVFSKTLRKIQISTGYGTEKILTDSICKNVIDQFMIPEFKNDNYYHGIKKGLEELISLWK